MGVHIGIFDIIIILLLILFNIIFWNKSLGCLMQVIGTLLYVLVFPLISMGVEIEIVSRKTGIIYNYEVLYIWLRFPLYWILYIVQLIVNKIKPKQNE